MRRGLLTALLAAACGAVLAGAGSAAADAGLVLPETRGIVQFKSHGDVLHVEDRKADGYGVLVNLDREDGGPAPTIRNTQGAGHVVTHNMNLREGSRMIIEACWLHANGRTSHCVGNTVRA